VSRRTFVLVTPLLALACQAWTNPHVTTVPFVAPRDFPASHELVRAGVRGVDCGPGEGDAGDIAIAVAAALSQAPGADLLVNASLTTHREAAARGLCIAVSGDAVKLE
jgi:hypothetical protein